MASGLGACSQSGVLRVNGASNGWIYRDYFRENRRQDRSGCARFHRGNAASRVVAPMRTVEVDMFKLDTDQRERAQGLMEWMIDHSEEVAFELIYRRDQAKSSATTDAGEARIRNLVSQWRQQASRDACTDPDINARTLRECANELAAALSATDAADKEKWKDFWKLFHALWGNSKDPRWFDFQELALDLRDGSKSDAARSQPLQPEKDSSLKETLPAQRTTTRKD